MREVLLYLLIVFHYLLVVSIGISVPFLILYEPLYISIPLLTWIYHLGFGSIRCPLTTLENVLRGRLGKPVIKNFIHKYILFKE